MLPICTERSHQASCVVVNGVGKGSVSRLRPRYGRIFPQKRRKKQVIDILTRENIKKRKNEIERMDGEDKEEKCNREKQGLKYFCT